MTGTKTRTGQTHHQAAERARDEPGVWVPGPVYPSRMSADSAAQRVPRAVNLSAYRPIGSFQAYAAPCESGAALWVRWIGGSGPAPQGMPARITVRIPSYADAPSYERMAGSVTVSVRPTCPVCGGPRGTAHTETVMYDGVPCERDKWVNPCGHQDDYARVLEEARRTPPSSTGVAGDDAPAQALPQIGVACPKCRAAAGALCTLPQGGRSLLLDVHRARREAWRLARIAAVPAAQHIHEARATNLGMPARHAARLLNAAGYPAEAGLITTAVALQGGHMSARQAVTLLVELDEARRGGEG